MQESWCDFGSNPHNARMLTRFLAPLFIIAACALPSQSGAAQQDSPEITLEQIMSDPEWIHREPTSPYWSDDSSSVYYHQKELGGKEHDLWRLNVATGKARIVLLEEHGLADESSGDYNLDRSRKVYSRHGDLFVRDLASGIIQQLTRTATRESSPRFLADQDRFSFLRDGVLYIRELSTGLELQPANLKLTEDPTPKPPEGFLEEQQQRLFDIIRVKREREAQAREYDRALADADATRAPRPWYLGENQSIDSRTLSPDERWMVLGLSADSKKSAKEERTEYVTRSGHMSARDLRANVGHAQREPTRFVLLDLVERERYDLSLDGLPGITSASSEEAPDTEAAEARPVANWGVRWAPDGSRAACMVRSHDNKDRWIFTIEKGKDSVIPVHHLHDDAWVGFRFNEWGWAQNGESLWFTSEESGYSHLYLWSASDGSTRALTSGEYEADLVGLDPLSDTLYFRANVDQPTAHEIYRISLASGEREQLTNLGGRIAYQLSPDSQRLLLTHSKPLSPPDFWVQDAEPGAEAKRITRTSTDKFHSFAWAEPELVAVPSRTGAEIHSRLYKPSKMPSEKRPAVMFVHGAGYLQNAHAGWSGYFREFLFHSLLVQEGYVVLDMDFRASAGYGSDWRTAIYRQMGTPELEDLEDGVDWLVANHGVDRDRVGVYGGSYGGFLTLMALFQKPDLFACGAALRPVTDWAHYNHEYTSNILNTPEKDPEAYLRSSPIEFAEGLKKPLLICHGVLDDNVLMKDSMRLAQRLIELGKENWEMALFPTEPHGFKEPASWLDEYRRIHSLFERELR